MKYRHIKMYKYELEHDCSLVVDIDVNVETEYMFLKDNILTARKGYCWNGASGPTIDTIDTMRPAMFHDCLYQLMRMGWGKPIQSQNVLPRG